MMTPALLSAALLLLLLPGAPAEGLKSCTETWMETGCKTQQVSQVFSRMMTPALLSAALLLLLLPGAPADKSNHYLITIRVTNSVNSAATLTYHTHVAKGGHLLGAMTTLQNSNADFKFTYTVNPDYGPYLVSVNDLAGSSADQTYWQLLVDNGTDWVPASVGIGCYLPSAREFIVLNFTTY